MDFCYHKSFEDHCRLHPRVRLLGWLCLSLYLLFSCDLNRGLEPPAVHSGACVHQLRGSLKEETKQDLIFLGFLLKSCSDFGLILK